MSLANALMARSPLLGILRARVRRFGRVLLYHRVVEDERSACFRPWLGVTVTRRAFERQLDYLGRHYRVVSLATLVDSMDDPVRLAGMAAITFDDGYADNLRLAMPALHRRGMPASIFAAAGFIGTDKRASIDRLARMAAANGAKPLTLDTGGGESIRIPYSRHGRSQFFAALDWLDRLPPERREAVFGGRFIVDEDRFLDPAELKVLERHGIRVEAHTVSHARLSELDEAGMTDEIIRGRAMLGEMVGRPIEFFAYPFGLAGDFTGAAKRVVQTAGFRAAFAAYPGLIDGRTDRFAIPRLRGGESYDRFRAKLARRYPMP